MKHVHLFYHMNFLWSSKSPFVCILSLLQVAPPLSSYLFYYACAFILDVTYYLPPLFPAHISLPSSFSGLAFYCSLPSPFPHYHLSPVLTSFQPLFLLSPVLIPAPHLIPVPHIFIDLNFSLSSLCLPCPYLSPFLTLQYHTLPYISYHSLPWTFLLHHVSPVLTSLLPLYLLCPHHFLVLSSHPYPSHFH